MELRLLSDLLAQVDGLRASVLEIQERLAAGETNSVGPTSLDKKVGAPSSDVSHGAGVKRILQAIEESLADPAAKENGYTVVFALVENRTGKEAQSLVACQSEGDIAAKIVPDDEISALTKAFSNPARLRLLRACVGGPRASSELSAATGLVGGQLYHHLKELVHSGFMVQDGYGTHQLTQLGKTAYLGISLLASTARAYEERRKAREHKEVRD